MRWNLLWYVPLAGAILFFPVLFDLVEAMDSIGRMLAHWTSRTWILFFSPAAALWASATVASVGIPLRTIFLLPISFNPETEDYNKRYRITAILLLEMSLSVFLAWVLIWGCFPFTNGPDGVRLRMIPFYPWPAQPFFSR